MDGRTLAVLHGIDDLLGQIVNGRLGLQLLQLILNRVLLRFQLFHAAIFKETLLVAEETVEIAHFLTVTIEHSTARLKCVRSKGASVELLVRFGLAGILEVLFADLAKDVFAQHVLFVARTAMLGEQSFLVLREISLMTGVDLGKSLLQGSRLEAPDAIRREAGPGLAWPLQR